jgi:hypothetical protein
MDLFEGAEPVESPLDFSFFCAMDCLPRYSCVVNQQIESSASVCDPSRTRKQSDISAARTHTLARHRKITLRTLTQKFIQV